MKTVTISRHARSITSLLEAARQDNLILEAPDGREFILAEIDAFDREIELTRQNKKLMEFLDRRATDPRRIPLADAKALLGLDTKTASS